MDANLVSRFVFILGSASATKPEGSLCQDVTHVEDYKGALIGVCCDGMGEAKRSDQGASFLVTFFCDQLRAHRDAYLDNSEEDPVLPKDRWPSLIKKAQAAIDAEFIKEEGSYLATDFDCTLQAVSYTHLTLPTIA